MISTAVVRAGAGSERRRRYREHRGGAAQPRATLQSSAPAIPDVPAGEQQQPLPRDAAGTQAELARVEGDQQRERHERERTSASAAGGRGRESGETISSHRCTAGSSSSAVNGLTSPDDEAEREQHEQHPQARASASGRVLNPSRRVRTGHDSHPSASTSRTATSAATAAPVKGSALGRTGAAARRE